MQKTSNCSRKRRHLEKKKMPLRNNNDDDNLINPIPRVSTPRVIPSFGAWKPYLYRTKTEIWKKKRLMSKNHVFNLSLKRFMVLDLGSLWQLLARGPRTTPITQRFGEPCFPSSCIVTYISLLGPQCTNTHWYLPASVKMMHFYSAVT